MTGRQDEGSRGDGTDAAAQRTTTFTVQLRRAVGAVRSIVETYEDLACPELNDAVTHLETTIGELTDDDDDEHAAPALCSADR
jgi:hypothetical protein